MDKNFKIALGEAELLLILEMCREGIEKCNVREAEHVLDRNNPAAEWDRRLRERYAGLRNEVLAELALRRRVIGAAADPPGAAAKGRNEPPAQ